IRPVPPHLYVFDVAFLRTAIAPRLGPLRVRALVCVRCPRTGSPRRCRSPRYAPISIRRLILNEISFRRSPSMRYCSSITLQIFLTDALTFIKPTYSDTRSGPASDHRAKALQPPCHPEVFE